MKKLILLAFAVCLILTGAACSGNAGDLSKFLADNEGEWYDRGDTGSDLLRIDGDGTWEFYEVTESGYERFMVDSGGAESISYDGENKWWLFSGGENSYICKTSTDGILTFKGSEYVPAQESCDLGETFDGMWYLDGDKDKDYYKFEGGIWDFYEAIGMGHGSSDSGYLTYRGGDTKKLTAVEVSSDEPYFAVLTVVSGDEIQSDGKSYLRLEGLDSDGDEDISAIYQMSYYYWNGDSEDDSLYFVGDEVYYDDPGYDTTYGTYYIEGDTLTLVWDWGDDSILSIEDDGKTLIGEQGECFYLAE